MNYTSNNSPDFKSNCKSDSDILQTWKKNLAAFKKRFPALYSRFVSPQIEENPPDDSFEVLKSKSGAFTAKDKGKLLHSLYNPEREGESSARTLKKSGEIYSALFCSAGLGWTALSYARLFPNDTLILAEPDPAYFFTALKYLDFTPIFELKNCILAIKAGTDDIAALIEHSGGFSHCAICENPAQTEHSREYFDALKDLLSRTKRKDNVNTTTLEKFSQLWLRNSCRNMKAFVESEGISSFENAAPQKLPFLILAAGPTLTEILPTLKKLQKRCVTVAVDTSLRACLRAGVQPDFVLLVDPQYYAWRHIAGLSSPNSILITESAAYPPVIRFDGKELLFCSSLFPPGKYVESKCGKKGDLDAGGSVSTSAWDFARFCGAKEIYFAGLDLGYPDLQTHARGSTAEEKIHTISNRLNSAEKMGIASLFGANMQKSADFDGNPLLSDDRMSLFAWWFESAAEKNPQVKSYSLSKKSRAIPGFSFRPVESLLSLDEKEFSAKKEEFFAARSKKQKSEIKNPSASYENILSELKSGLASLEKIAKEGEKLADSALTDRSKVPAYYMSLLEKTDAKILRSDFKDIASLVFPTERKLNEIFAQTAFPQDPAKALFMKSRIIYRELQKSVSNYRQNLD